MFNCRVIICPVINCRVIDCRVINCRVIICPVINCRVIDCRVIKCPYTIQKLERMCVYVGWSKLCRPFTRDVMGFESKSNIFCQFFHKSEIQRI